MCTYAPRRLIAILNDMTDHKYNDKENDSSDALSAHASHLVDYRSDNSGCKTKCQQTGVRKDITEPSGNVVEVSKLQVQSEEPDSCWIFRRRERFLLLLKLHSILPLHSALPGIQSVCLQCLQTCWTGSEVRSVLREACTRK